MADDVVTILRVDTGEAVKSVNDLKENIKILKDNLGTLEIGTEEYQDTLEELKINQNALKDAMYATSASMEDVAKAATGASETYNGLVHRMAALKEELRATDVSTEKGKKQFQDLALKIKGVNDKLKEMDALQGNYQRNVGNYKSALYGLGDVLKGLPPTLGSMREQAAKLGDTINLVGKQPILGIIGLLAPMLMKIADALKENETATNAIKKAMDALKPVMDLVSKALEVVAGWVSKVVDWFVQMAGESGDTFKRIISGAVGVSNALKEYMLMPIKTAVEAFKGLGNVIRDVFTGDFKSIKEDARVAAQGIGDAFKEGVSFKANFEEGKRIGDEFVAGLGESKVKKTAEDKGYEIGKSVAEGIDKGLMEIREGWEDKMDITLAAKLKAQKQAADEAKELNDLLEADVQETMAFVEETMAEADRMIEDSNRASEEAAKRRIQIMEMTASATSSILGSIADLYESDQKNSVKNEKKVKALRIAGATIDTISGSLSAFMQVWKDPGLAAQKAVLAPIMAASVLASGMAEIAKIKSTDVSGNTTASNAAIAPSMPSAPSINFEIPNIRSVTSQSEEDRLNQMASDQRVILVMSDLEVKEHQQRVQVAEATF